MQDNACPHVARVRIEYLQEDGIQVLDWPAVSQLNMLGITQKEAYEILIYTP